MMRKAIRGHLSQNPKLEQLLPHIVGNVGFVFTKEELVDVRDLLLNNKVKAPARAGAIAPLDVTVPAQNTGFGPEKTSFFQALNIPTKITKGTIEIVADVKLIKEGDKVGMSDSTLLNMLGISPFTYGLVIQKVYDSGTVFDPAILDITDDDLKAIHGWSQKCCRCLIEGWIPQHCLRSSLCRQWIEELHGCCSSNRHHLQRSRNDEGVPCRSKQVRCCRCCSSCWRCRRRKERRKG